MKRPSHDDVLGVACRLDRGGCGAGPGEPCSLTRPRSSNEPFLPDFALRHHPARVLVARASYAQKGGRG